ncbi:MAG: tyrosine-type recombinase/integrase [Magnetococcales bacterium]|nr:tyrosine-type recombinase/integrase [Magnetococcales bacterium]
MIDTTIPVTIATTAIADQNAILARLAEFDRYARGALAKNTERAIRADITRFVEFCAQCGMASLPSTPETVAAFVDAMATHCAPATIRRYVSSISTYHQAAGLESPTRSMPVRLTLKKMSREKGTRQTQAAPINRRLVNEMLESDRGTFRDLRDLALVLVGYDVLCRRSELAALDVADFTFCEDGSGTVLIRRSKSDQEGAGAVRFIAPDTVERVKKWMKIAKIQQGAMFRGINNANAMEERLSDKGVARAFKRMAALTGADAEGISGHSCRVGAAQDMVSAGLEIAGVMQAGGWKSPVMVARYTEKLMARRGASAQLARIQGRS